MKMKPKKMKRKKLKTNKRAKAGMRKKMDINSVKWKVMVPITMLGVMLLICSILCIGQLRGMLRSSQTIYPNQIASFVLLINLSQSSAIMHEFDERGIAEKVYVMDKINTTFIHSVLEQTSNRIDDFIKDKITFQPTGKSAVPLMQQRQVPAITYFNKADRGGHFAAWEEPELFSAEVRAAFSSLR